MKILKPYSINYIFLFLTIINFFGCSNFKTNDYVYIDGFAIYMKSEFKIDIYNTKEDNIYYLMLVKGCEPCIIENTQMLANIDSDKLVLLLVGDPKESNKYEELKSLTKKFNTLNDRSYEIFSYETGISKPLLIHMKNGECIKYMKVSDFDVNLAKEYIISEND